MKPLIAATAILCLLLGACASSGVHVDEASAKSFKKGKSTISDVSAKLGKPTTKTTDSNGNTELRYDYIETQIRPESFIPYVGYAVGGSDMRITMAVFKFDSRGVLRDYSFSVNETGTGMNLSSGTTFNRVEAQPKSNK